jgi:hypothetical protein
MRQHIPPFLLNRLRMDPIASTVPGSLPVLFFGDLFSATVATVGINPSRQEYLTPDGKELDGIARRFGTLSSLNTQTRDRLTDAQATIAIERMRAYFDPEKQVYSWFNSLNRVVDGMGFSFSNRSAAHLDLIQEATDPVWSGLHGADRSQATAVMTRDVPFLGAQIRRFPLRAIICTSARVVREVTAALSARTTVTGKLKRITWSIALAETRRGIVGIAGWNIPLARPTGLDRDGHRQLGALLRAELERAGILLHT